MDPAIRPRPWKRVALLTLLAIGAAFYAAPPVHGQGAQVQGGQPYLNQQTVMVEQIQLRSKSAPVKIEPVPQRPVSSKEAASTAQLPPGLHPVSDEPGQETGLTSPDTAAPDLMGEVARAWTVIRNRGQQPTPELIAREIGPDLLTAFLNQYPNGVALITSQQPPSAPPPPEPPPENP